MYQQYLLFLPCMLQKYFFAKIQISHFCQLGSKKTNCTFETIPQINFYPKKISKCQKI